MSSIINPLQRRKKAIDYFEVMAYVQSKEEIDNIIKYLDV